MLSLTLFFLAGVMNAIMDNIAHHFHISVFRSWTFAKPDWTRKYIGGDPRKGRKLFLGVFAVPVAFYDLWHLCKFLMIFFFCGAAVYHQRLLSIWLDPWIYAVVFSSTFLMFYKVILREDRKSQINKLLIQLRVLKKNHSNHA